VSADLKLSLVPMLRSRSTNQEIAQVLQVSGHKIDRALRRFVQDGL